jgi:hypothetical protein
LRWRAARADRRSGHTANDAASIGKPSSRRRGRGLGLIAETEANAVLVDLDRLAAMLTRLAGYGA